MAERSALLRQRPRSAPMDLLYKRSTDKAMEAQRKNRVETGRHRQLEATIDRLKVMSGVTWQHEKEQVRHAMNVMRMTTGYWEQGRSPGDGNNDPYEKSPYALNRLSEKKLARWRVQEKTLRRTVLHPDTIRQLQPPWERESLDKKTETLVNVLRLVGYKDREVKEMIDALQHPETHEKTGSGDVEFSMQANDKNYFKTGARKRVDVFESFRSNDDQPFSANKWANQVLNNYMNGVENHPVSRESSASYRSALHQDDGRLGSSKPKDLSQLQGSSQMANKSVKSDVASKSLHVRPHTTIGSHRRVGVVGAPLRPKTTARTSTQRNKSRDANLHEEVDFKHANIPDATQASTKYNINNDNSNTRTAVDHTKSRQELHREKRALNQIKSGRTLPHGSSATPGVRKTPPSEHTPHGLHDITPAHFPGVEKSMPSTHGQPIPIITINNEVPPHRPAPTRYPKLPGSEKRRDNSDSEQDEYDSTTPAPRWRRQLLFESPQGLHSAAQAQQPIFTTRSQRRKDLDQLVEAHENDIGKSIRKAHLRKLQCRIKVYVALTRLGKMAPKINEEGEGESSADKPSSRRSSLIRHIEGQQRLDP